MNCSFAEKVSMMIDGELRESEAKKVQAHIAGCGECRALEKDFLFFREQLSEPDADRVADRIKIPKGKRFSFWEKGISVPVPVFAGFLLVAVSLCIGLIVWRSGQSEKIAIENPVKNNPMKSENAGDLSISRFDKGGRAEIYVAPRQER